MLSTKEFAEIYRRFFFVQAIEVFQFATCLSSLQFLRFMQSIHYIKLQYPSALHYRVIEAIEKSAERNLRSS